MSTALLFPDSWKTHHQNRYKRPGGNGFTMIEMVMTLVIISILAAIAIPRFSSSDNALMAQAYRLARDLRHVQSMAMTQGRTLLLDFQSLTSYRVTSAGSTVIDPATMQPYQVTMENDVLLNGSDTEFDNLGRPVASGTLLGTERVFTLSSNSRTATVILSPVTGFVAVSP
ncbi:MAG: prepilin-type N-terminal cleavage/methylation domain-containing protein [Granulosicoccus sp.]|nr:prepilin-type N-terminal cleavage/methylation domain-containing protein [Granulosicoccus sp.]